MRRRIVALIAAGALACASLTLMVGCSSGGSSSGSVDYSGTYVYASSTSADGNSVTTEQVEALGYEAGYLSTLTLNSDGSASWTMMDEDVISGVTISWNAAENVVTISASDGSSLECPVTAEGQLTMDYQSQQIVYQKQ